MRVGIAVLSLGLSALRATATWLDYDAAGVIIGATGRAQGWRLSQALGPRAGSCKKR